MPRSITALKCRICNQPIRYTRATLMMKPFPLEPCPVESCSISCDQCLDSAKKGFPNVLDIPLYLLLDAPLNEAGSLCDVYQWDDFSIQQLNTVIGLARTQKQAEEKNVALAH